MNNMIKPYTLLLAELIKDLGYSYQSSSWDRETLEIISIEYVPFVEMDDAIKLERVINSQNVWQIYVGENKIEIVHAFKGSRRFGFMDLSKPDDKKMDDLKPMMEFERLFYGKVNGVSELMRVMDQVGAPFDK